MADLNHLFQAVRFLKLSGIIPCHFTDYKEYKGNSKKQMNCASCSKDRIADDPDEHKEKS